jgi:hypothetical protein
MAELMDTTTTNVDRWRDFKRTDLLLIQGALCEHAERVTQDAEADRIRPRERAGAAATFLRSSALAYEISDVMGEKHPPVEDAAVMAYSIETGEFAALAKQARLQSVKDDIDGGEWS